MGGLLTCVKETLNRCQAAKDSSCSVCIQSGKGCSYCSDENKQINVKLNQSQVAPQHMRMRLAPGEEHDVEMHVFEPTRGPLDLYILMDFSNSMSDDLDNLKRMGDELDFYSSTTVIFEKRNYEPVLSLPSARLKQPWPNSDPPFSFKNVIKLTDDINDFRKKLQKERISGNLDAPEGGFDAILQTAVCQENIGWRPHSTHLLVFSTESAFHYEADGANVLAGILPRNDEACHLTADGTYTHYIQQDYPSVPTLVRLLGKHNIIPIFAVTNHSISYYQSIRSKISMRAEDMPKALKAEFLSAGGKVAEYGNFLIKPGETGTFKVRVKALDKYGEEHVCQLPEEDREGTMRVKPTTFSTAFNIDAGVLCQTCECEKLPVKKAERCSRNGDLVCGKCRCDDGWLGSYCNCSSGAVTDNKGCIEPGASLPCSGHGDCLCGTCVCSSHQYEGPYCQYDKTQCPRFAGFLCNDRGSCYLGQCACDEGWEGLSCECPKSNQTCLDSKGAQVGICEAKRSCVQCKAWKTGERKEGDRCAKECNFEIQLVKELPDKKDVIETCTFRDEDDDCTYHYTVDYPVNASSVHKVLVREKKGELSICVPIFVCACVCVCLCVKER
ncbi:hypothetical protein JZ751_026731 [Albula glossodonta]|uniref:Integrin beta n=1 Tax=Albula glossodonta TaxID=121402 RepID=A0A8T2PF73_9TELE|nr:hypothetical protein JZ751_026731 [Albula glossodonta]